MLDSLKDRAAYYSTLPRDSFAPKAGDQSLNVAIIGAGIAGLSAAVALAQCGHNVEIFERSAFANEIGAAINMAPNASRLLGYYGFDFEAAQATEVEEAVYLNSKTLETDLCIDHSDIPERYGAPWYFFHRIDLHSELKRMALEPRPSISNVAKLHLKSGVENIELDGTMTLESGIQLQKDLIVVADGVHSKFATKVVGKTVRSIPTGTAAFRFVIPTKVLLECPKTRSMFDRKHIGLNFSLNGDKNLIWYPCRRGELQNFGLYYPDDIPESEGRGWNIPTSLEHLMKVVADFHPTFGDVCRQAVDVKLFKLLARDPIERLAKGKIVLIGDAAHPMLPYQGQGGGMAVEDAATLGVLFSDLKSVEEVPALTQLFDDLRHDRVSAMQIFSSAGQHEAAKIAKAASRYVHGPLPKNQHDYHEFNFTPNILRDAMSALSNYKAQEALKNPPSMA